MVASSPKPKRKKMASERGKTIEDKNVVKGPIKPKTSKNEDVKKKAFKRKMITKKGESKKQKLEEVSKKERKKRRKMVSQNYALSHEAKKYWEDLRRADLSPAKKGEICVLLYKLVKTKCKELIYAHDTSRVIQCLMKHSKQEQRNAIFEELKDEILNLSKTPYGKFFVRKLLKYGTKEQRQHVFKSLYGNVRKLIKHKEACSIIELAYNDYANASERAALVEEFYGPSFAVFKTAQSTTLSEILEKYPDKKENILMNMRDSLSALIHKEILQLSIVHKVFVEYLSHCSEKQRLEMVELLREKVIHMLHTRDGSRIAMYCLWYGTAKDRKVIIKSMKSFVVKICKEEYGHLVLLALFDVVDDTKMVSKVILEEMLKSIDDVAQDRFGRKVVLYLLSPRNPKYFHPDVVKVLQNGDDNVNSKKNKDVRRDELLEFVSKPFVTYIVNHCAEIVFSNADLVLLLAVISYAKSDLKEAFSAIARIAGVPFKSSKESQHIIEHPAGHMTLKKLIQLDSTRIKQGSQVLFSTTLLEFSSNETLKTWAACNRGCFLLVFLIELGDKSVTDRVLKELFPMLNTIKQLEFKGAELLSKKLQEII